MRIVVDFPAPFGPRNPYTLLGGTVRLQPAHCDGIPESLPDFFDSHHGVHSISLVDTKEMKEVPAGVLFLGLSRPLCSYAGDDIRYHSCHANTGDNL